MNANPNGGRCEIPWSSVLYLCLGLGLSIYYLDDYADCKWPFAWMRTIMMGLMLLFMLVVGLPDNYIITKTLLFVLCGIQFIGWDVTGIYFYTDNLITNDKCVEQSTTITDGIIIGIVTVFLITVFGGIIFFVVGECRTAKRKNMFKKELKQVYKKVHKKGFNMDKFIEKFKDDIDGSPQIKEEHAILKDMYTSKYDENKVYSEEVCCICVCDLKGEEPLMEFPHCGHTMHFDCLMGWFKEKMECPMCRGKIRESLLRGVYAKVVEGRENGGARKIQPQSSNEAVWVNVHDEKLQKA